MTAEWKRQQAEAKTETARLIALEREQMRIAREQERQAKEAIQVFGPAFCVA